MTTSCRAVPLTLLILMVSGGAGCSEPAPPQGTAALETARDVAQGITAGSGTNPMCAMFTQDEIGEWLGALVGSGETAGPMGTACQWDGTDTDPDAESTHVQIQVLEGSEYWAAPRLGEGYEDLKGIATQAYVIPEWSGWSAGALTEKSTIVVSMSGGTSNRDSTVKLLRTVIERSAASPL
jgi:hypothetical protein